MQNIHFIDMPRQRFLTHPLREEFVITHTWWVLFVVLVGGVCSKKNEWIKLSVVTLALKYGSWWFKRGTMQFSLPFEEEYLCSQVYQIRKESIISDQELIQTFFLPFLLYFLPSSYFLVSIQTNLCCFYNT